MKSVTTYLDYRVFLREYYEYQKQLDSFFSYRYIAGKVGLDHGYVVKLLQEKVHIAEKYIDKFASLCHLEERDAQYFKTLVHFNKAKHENQIKILFDKLVSLAGVEIHELNKNQYEFYTKWYYTAVRAVLSRMEFRDNYAVLAKSLSPKITESQIARTKDGMEMLVIEKILPRLSIHEFCLSADTTPINIPSITAIKMALSASITVRGRFSSMSPVTGRFFI